MPLSPQMLEKYGFDSTVPADLSVEGICCTAIELCGVIDHGSPPDNDELDSMAAIANFNLAKKGYDITVDSQYIGSLLVEPHD